MSIMFKDPIKYKKIVEEFEKQEENLLKNTLTSIRNMDDNSLGEFLDHLGKFLHHIRRNNQMSLRAFCKKYNLKTSVVAEVERGLRLPDLEIMDIYLRDGIKEK